jgi:hypothetical protein
MEGSDIRDRLVWRPTARPPRGAPGCRRPRRHRLRRRHEALRTGRPPLPGFRVSSEGYSPCLLPCKKQTKYRDACGRDVVQPTKAGRLLDLLPLRSPPMKTSRHCHARVRPLTPPRPPDTPAAARTPPLRQPARRTSAPPRPIRRRLHAAGAHVVLALRNSDEDSWRTCMFSAAQYHFKARSLIEKYFATCFRLTFTPT